MSDIDIIIASQSVEIEAEGTVASYVGTVTNTDDWRTTWTFELLYYLAAYTATGDLEILIDGTNATVNGGTFATITLDGTQSLTFRGDGIDYTLGGDMTENGETLAAGTYTVVALWGNDSVSISVALVNESGTLALSDPDETAPVFSNVTVSDVTATTASFNAQINEAGTILWAVHPTATSQRTKAQIEAGTDAVAYGTISTAGSTIETDAITGLSDETAYKVHYFGRDTALNESTATLTGEFTTGDVTAPNFSNVSVDNIAATTADFNAEIDEAGTIYWAVYASATSQQSNENIQGGTGAVAYGNIVTSGSTIETDGITGLTAETAYKVHYFAEDGNGNESTGAMTSEFTTEAAASFHPNDLSPAYFDETERTFNGSNYVDAGIYNAAATNNYWHVWVKIAPSDGNPSANQAVFGCRTADLATTLNMLINTTGQVLTTTTNIIRRTNDSIFTDGVNAAKVIHMYRTPSTFVIRIDGTSKTLNATTTTNPTSQTTRPMAYGASNSDAVIGSYFTGTGYGIFIWGGATDLTSDQKTDLDNYFAAL